MSRIVLLGPPGCGKGTQSKLLVKKKNYIQLSTGDLLREETSKNSDLGKKISMLMESGELVSDDIVINIIVNKVEEYVNESVIFDGFPRNLNQARVLDKALENISLELNSVIFFKIDFEILKERIQNRIKQADSSDFRKDDNIETLLNRIEVYKSSTLPIVEYYEKKGILTKINAMEDIEKVNEEILKIIS